MDTLGEDCYVETWTGELDVYEVRGQLITTIDFDFNEGAEIDGFERENQFYSELDEISCADCEFTHDGGDCDNCEMEG